MASATRTAKKTVGCLYQRQNKQQRPGLSIIQLPISSKLQQCFYLCSCRASSCSPPMCMHPCLVSPFALESSVYKKKDISIILDKCPYDSKSMSAVVCDSRVTFGKAVLTQFKTSMLDDQRNCESAMVSLHSGFCEVGEELRRCIVSRAIRFFGVCCN